MPVPKRKPDGCSPESLGDWGGSRQCARPKTGRAYRLRGIAESPETPGPALWVHWGSFPAIHDSEGPFSGISEYVVKRV